MNRDVKKHSPEPLRAEKPKRKNTLEVKNQRERSADETRQEREPEEEQTRRAAPETESRDTAEPPQREQPGTQESGRELRWSAPEYVYFEKTADWYWILGIVVAALVAVAFVLGNLLFVIFTLLAGFTVAVLGSRQPERFNFAVNERGVKIGSDLYPYPTLDFFWIDEDGPISVLIIESKKVTMRHIVIPLENINSNDLRFFLEEFLPEEYIERPWSQRLMERIGF